MKAAILYETRRPFQIEEVEIDDPGPGKVLVKLMASGVCHSDWHVVKGEWESYQPLPAVLGHEGAGVVEAIGPGVRNVQVGDHVILSWRTNCGMCEQCMKGFPVLCTRPPDSAKPHIHKGGQSFPVMAGLGTFGHYSLVSEGAAIPIGRDVPFPQAALIGCGVMTGVGAAINTAKVQPGSTVAVFGCGGVGLNCIQGAALGNPDMIIAVDVLDNKLDRAREFGATHTINSSREDAVERIKELSGGLGVHYAFEAIGLGGDTFVQSIQCTRKRGLTVWVGHAPENTVVPLDARMLIPEKIIMGSLYGSARPYVDFQRIIKLYGQGKLKLDELVSRIYPVEQVNDAFDALAKGEVARSVLTFE